MIETPKGVDLAILLAAIVNVTAREYTAKI